MSEQCHGTTQSGDRCKREVKGGNYCRQHQPEDDTPDVEYIISPLRGHAHRADNLSLDPSNAREHSERNLQAIMRSMREFGQRQVIVAREDNHTVVAGNGRLMAARQLGWDYIATVFVDDDDLTAMRYAIADNRTAELADWDEEVLGQTLELLRDEGALQAVGFKGKEAEEILGDLAFEECQRIEEENHSGETHNEYWGVVVVLSGEQAQLELLEQLEAEGYDQCQALIS